MTIAFGTSGAAATGTTSLSVPYPASIAAGDLLVLCVANKYPTNGPTTPSGFTLPTNGRASGGAGANGIDTGSVYSTVYYKVATGSETGNLTVTITSGNSAVGRMFRYTKASSKFWQVAAVNGADNTAGTAWSVTGGSDPGISGADVVVCGTAINSDAYNYSAQSLAAAGVTFASNNERQDSGTTSGQDCCLYVSDHIASSGTSSAAPVFTMTASGSAANAPAGATVFLRLREESRATGTTDGLTTVTASAARVVTRAVTTAGVTTLSGVSSVVKTVVGTISASATLIAAWFRVVLRIAGIVGTNTITATASKSTVRTGLLEGLGALSGATRRVRNTQGTIDGTGVFSGTNAIRIRYVSGTLSGQSAITGVYTYISGSGGGGDIIVFYTMRESSSYSASFVRGGR